MIFIDRDVATRKYGYKVMLNSDPVSGTPTRILVEEYGWDDPGSVLNFAEELKKAVLEGIKTTFK